MIRSRYFLLFLWLPLFFVSCKKKEEKALQPAPGKDLVLSQTQIRLANIQTDTVGKGDMVRELLLTGTVALNPSHISSISARLDGRIERLLVKNPGEPLSSGQPLYELYSEELLATQQDYLLALEKQKQIKTAAPNYAALAAAARQKLLLWGISKKQLQQLEQTGRVQPAVGIQSPVSGIVLKIAKAEGDYVSQGSVIFEVADLSSVWVEAQLYASELAQISKGSRVEVSLAAFPNEPRAGKIVFTAPELLPDSKIALVRVEIKNPPPIYRPGMQAYIRLSNTWQNTLLIPSQSIIRDARGNTVWIRNHRGGFEPRMVATGMENNGLTEIRAGLHAGEEIVVSGAYLLHSQYLLTRGDIHAAAGHHH